MRLLFFFCVCVAMGGASGALAEERTTERTYYDNGQVHTSVEFKDGVQDGYTRVYYDNGQLQQEFYYTDGRPTFVGKQYFASGKLAADAEPTTGMMKRYDEESGSIIEKTPFVNGRKDGTRFFYDLQGKKIGFQTCQNNVCGARTDISNSPWYRYIFAQPEQSFWVARWPYSILQRSQAFLQEKTFDDLLRLQQVTPDNPQIKATYNYNEKGAPTKIRVDFPISEVQATIEKEYTYEPRSIVWKLNGIAVWEKSWADGILQEGPLNQARVSETIEEKEQRKRIVVQSPDGACPVYLAFVLNDQGIVKTEEMSFLYWEKQQGESIQRTLIWAWRPDGRLGFTYFQLPDRSVRVQYVYSGERFIGESWLETYNPNEQVQFDISYMRRIDGRLTGQILSVYDKEHPFSRDVSWDAIRQDYAELPLADENVLKDQDI